MSKQKNEYNIRLAQEFAIDIKNLLRLIDSSTKIKSCNTSIELLEDIVNDLDNDTKSVTSTSYKQASRAIQELDKYCNQLKDLTSEIQKDIELYQNINQVENKTKEKRTCQKRRM